MISFYLVCLIVAVLVLVVIMASDGFRSKNQTFLAIIILISNAGYLALALSTDLSGALLATKMTYVGGMFAALFFFTVIADLCGINIPNFVRIPMFVIQMVLYACVCLAGYNDWYYKNISYINVNGMGDISKDYGPVHSFYIASLLIYALASLVVVGISFRRKNKISTKNIVALFSVLLVGIVVSRAEKIWSIEIMPLVYILFEIGVYNIIYKVNMFSIERNVVNDVKDNENAGYVVLDKKLNFMSFNEYMENIVPNIIQYSLEMPVPKGNVLSDQIIPLAYEQMDRRMKGEDNTDTTASDEDEASLVTIGEHIYRVFMRPAYLSGKLICAYVLSIEDVTDRELYVRMIRQYNKNLEDEVKEKTKRIREIQQKTILGMAQMVESRDLSTGGHIKRTSMVVSVFSDALLKADYGLDEKFLNYVIRSAPMHDLGKIAVDDVILRKQGKFTDEEYAIMKKHSEAGAKIVSEILTGIEEDEFVRVAVNVAHYHHEKVNGKGYPCGLKGEEIPVEARIMALADVFDALVSKRCYKEAFTFDKAFAIIKEDAGTHFDAKLAEIFISCRPELEELYRSSE